MRTALRARKGIVEKKMFGGYCWMLNGNMLCGVEVGCFMFRVGKGLEADALSHPRARPMDITGRPMRGFIWVDAEAAKGADLEQWIALAERYVGSLPPKLGMRPQRETVRRQPSSSARAGKRRARYRPLS